MKVTKFFGNLLQLIYHFHSLDRKIREVLLKGKAQYRLPPCTSQVRSASFNIESTIYLFYKTSSTNEEVNCTEPSPLVSIPW